ncbi:uncharacterized protein LOC132600320 [Lycium barbarum]|uniref:uncharacterized protein LOC132600320 n=1 Tax=Lycium barbarum TaxID=112863 RepID=UPI00293E8ECB|nr:uncharacterized protein LOC132600320 [Lycium barbarum]
MCLPKSVCGQNVININLWNRAAMAKACWDLTLKNDSLWIKWIHVYYIKGRQMTPMIIPQQASWMTNVVTSTEQVTRVEKLAKWGIQVNPTCSLCQLQDETLEHLFVQCPYAKQLWNKLLHWLGQPVQNFVSWDAYLRWVVQSAKGKSSSTQALSACLLNVFMLCG